MQAITDIGGPAQPLLTITGLVKHFPLKKDAFGRGSGVGPAGQNQWHPRADDQTGRLRVGHEAEVFVHHVASLDVGRQQHVGQSGNR